MQRTNPVPEAVLLELLAHAAVPVRIDDDAGAHRQLADHVDAIADELSALRVEAHARVAPAPSIGWTPALDGTVQADDLPADVRPLASHVGGAR